MKSLRARHKKILRAIRIFSAWETANVRATGGGPLTKQPDTDGIVVTGSLLLLREKFGISISGMYADDCDAGELLPPIFESKQYFY